MALAPADHEVGSASRHYPVRGNGSHRNGGRHGLERNQKRGVYTSDYAAHMSPFLAMVFENGRIILDDITSLRDLKVFA
jgi:hypothetical protein